MFKFACALLLATQATAQTVLLSVPLTFDGRELSMDLLDSDSTPLMAAARTVEFNKLGAVLDGDQPSQLVEQLAEVMMNRINEENARRSVQPPAADPIASFSVQGEDGKQYVALRIYNTRNTLTLCAILSRTNNVIRRTFRRYTFNHFEGNDVALEAQQFCQQIFPSIELAPCANQLIQGADQVLRDARRANRKLVFATVIEINGQQMELTVGEGEDAQAATSFFCEGLDLDNQNFEMCMNGVIPTVETRIVEYMDDLASQRAQPPLFELPMKIGDKVLPLAFTLAEHPRETAARFCQAQWDFIITVLRSDDPNTPIGLELCQNTLFDLVVGMIDELLGSEQGLALAAEQRAFKLDIELTPEVGTPAQVQTIELNVFAGQTAQVAVDNFLRRTGIGEAARAQLVEVVQSQM